MSNSTQTLLTQVEETQLQELQLYQQHNRELLSSLEKTQMEVFFLNQQLAELESESMHHDAEFQDIYHELNALQALFDESPNAIGIINEHGKILKANQAFKTIIKALPNSNGQLFVTSFFDKRSKLSFNKHLQHALEMGHSSGEVTLTNHELMGYNLIKPAYKEVNTELMLSINRMGLDSSDSFLYRLAKLAVEQIKEGLMITDRDYKIVYVNHSFSEITGFSYQEAIGQSPKILQSGRHGSSFYENMYDELNSKGWWSGEIWNKRKSGDIYPEYLQITRTLDETTNNVFYVSSFSDITSRKVYQQRLDRLAFFDSLTNLPNRLSLENHVENLISRIYPDLHSIFAFLFLDLDKFKAINDTFGHSEGDAILVQAAQRIVASIRSDDFAARIGGDEFVVVLTRITSKKDVIQVAEKLIKSLNEPFNVKTSVPHHLGTSIGISFFPEDGLNLDDLMRRADAAMYKAKADGRNCYRVFDHSLEKMAEEEIRLLNLVKQSIRQPKQHIKMHYQPIFRQGSNRPVAFESLIRIQNSGEEHVRPDRFIKLAEDNSLISDLGLAIFEQVCCDLKQSGLPTDLSIEVNLSPMQFLNDGLLEDLKSVATHNGVDFKRFNFEVTETATIENLAIMIDILQQMRTEGADLLLDDFGTGYASLSMLKNLPTNIIKIDRSFIMDLDSSEQTPKLVLALITMAKSLGLKIVAEGVETEAQKQWLEENGVDYFQGYLLGKPIPIEEVMHE